MKSNKLIYRFVNWLNDNPVSTVFGMYGVLFILFLIICIPVSLWTQSNINWLLEITGSNKQIGFALSYLATVIFNAAAIPINVALEILKLFF